MFDIIVTQARWLALLGDKAYDFALTANRFFNAHAPHLRRALLVAVEMGQAEGEERGQLYRRLREGAGDRGQAPSRRRRDLRPHPHRRHARRFRPALHQLRRLGRKLHGGGRAPRRHSSRSSPGRRPARTARPRPGKPSKKPHEDPGRHRRVAPAGQRRGAHAWPRRARGARARRRTGIPRAVRILDAADAELSGNPAGADRGRATSSAGSIARGRTPSTSRPKDRSATRCAASASGAACRSPPAFTRAFPIIWRNGCRCRSAGPAMWPGAGCGAFTRRRGGAGGDADAWRRTRRRAASRT